MCLSVGYDLPSASSSSPTVLPSAFTYVWLPAKRRKGVGMYTITDIKFSPALMLCLHCQISFAGVREDRHDTLTFAQALCDPKGGHHIGPRRDADEKAFLPAEPPRHLDRVVVADGDDLVVDFAVQNIRHEARPDALDSVHPGAPTLQHRRAGGLNRHDQKSGHTLPDNFTDACDGAACSHAQNER